MELKLRLLRSGHCSHDPGDPESRGGSWWLGPRPLRRWLQLARAGISEEGALKVLQQARFLCCSRKELPLPGRTNIAMLPSPS